ncbi:MAG: helix-turn-helix domain-containing protein [Polyangiaceae bacterium]
MIVACSELGAEPHRALQIAIDEAGAGTLVLDRVDRSPSGATPALLELCDPPRLAARVIATGAASLREAARAGDMNSELFHRFAGRIFDVPPLRVRDACIPVLAAVFARGAAERMGLPVPRIAVEAVRALKSAPWPDNLPELRAAIEAAVAAAPIRAAGANDRRGSVLTLGDFGLVRPRRAGRIEGTLEPYAEARTRALAEFERNYVVDVLAHTGGNVSRAAHLAGMDRANFRRLAKRAMEKQRRSS